MNQLERKQINTVFFWATQIKKLPNSIDMWAQHPKETDTNSKYVSTFSDMVNSRLKILLPGNFMAEVIGSNIVINNGILLIIEARI